MDPSPPASFTARGGCQQSTVTAREVSVRDGDPAGGANLLHKAERKYEVGKIIDEEEAKQRKFRGILNKLTSRNFWKLFQQIKRVRIDNIITLTGLASQIYEKAVIEPTYCQVYATLCSNLNDVLPDLVDVVDNKKITCRRVLLNFCQAEFESEDARLKARCRWLGNIRFIAELYKLGWLTERIVNRCIGTLLLGQHDQNPDEVNIEGLCMLLSTIGEKIDHFKAKKCMDAYFDSMRDLSNNMKLSSRSRFMLMDVIELREDQWQQRRMLSRAEGSSSTQLVMPKVQITLDLDNHDSWRQLVKQALDGKLVSYVVDGLDFSYGPFCKNLNMRSQPVSPREMFGLLLQEEQRLNEESHFLKTSGNAVHRSSTPSNNFSRNKSGSSFSSRSTYNNANRFSGSNDNSSMGKRVVCQICEKLGHTARDCWHRDNKEAFPPRHSQRSVKVNVASTTPSDIVDPSWYLDTSATNHVTVDLQESLHGLSI